MRVVEDVRHQAERDRRDDARAPGERAGRKQVGDEEREPHHQHAGEAERRAVVLEDLEAIVQERVREREQALHERGVLVIVLPDRIDRGALESLDRRVGEEREPALVVVRGREIEALVAREAEATRGGEQPRDVDRRDPAADERIGVARGPRAGAGPEVGLLRRRLGLLRRRLGLPRGRLGSRGLLLGLARALRGGLVLLLRVVVAGHARRVGVALTLRLIELLRVVLARRRRRLGDAFALVVLVVGALAHGTSLVSASKQ